jgi:hypothetical protein
MVTDDQARGGPASVDLPAARASQIAQGWLEEFRCTPQLRPSQHGGRLLDALDVAHLVRSGAACRSIWGQTGGLQRLPGQAQLYDLSARAGSDTRNRSLAVLGGGTVPRGIACCVAMIGVRLPLGMLFSKPSLVDLLALLATILLVCVASVPLARHLWRTPRGFPEHIPQRCVYEDPACGSWHPLGLTESA